MNRRQFLKTSVLGTLGLVLAPLVRLPEESDKPPAVKEKKGAKANSYYWDNRAHSLNYYDGGTLRYLDKEGNWVEL